MKAYGKCEYCGKTKEYQYPSLVKRFCSHKCANLAAGYCMLEMARAKKRWGLSKYLIGRIEDDSIQRK